jgi:hypothetical protein
LIKWLFPIHINSGYYSDACALSSIACRLHIFR